MNLVIPMIRLFIKEIWMFILVFVKALGFANETITPDGPKEKTSVSIFWIVSPEEVFSKVIAFPQKEQKLVPSINFLPQFEQNSGVMFVN